MSGPHRRIQSVVERLLQRESPTRAALFTRASEVLDTERLEMLQRVLAEESEAAADADFMRTGGGLDREFLEWLDGACPEPENSLDSDASLDRPQSVGSVHLGRLVGAGGMGAVYEGWDQRLERRVAVKALARGRLTRGFKDRLLSEARALARLEHPEICRLYDLVEDESGSYLLLEFVDGKTLLEAIPDLSSEEKLEFARRLAGALEVAHRAGVVHGDLKPENIMVTTEAGLKVLDFGVARLLDGAPEGAADLGEKKTVQTSGGVLGPAGTLAFMSPEQVSGRPITPASDIFSFGLLLFELMAGRTAYDLSLPKDRLIREVAGGQPKVLGSELNVDELQRSELLSLIQDATKAEPGSRPTASETFLRLGEVQEKPKNQRQARARRWLVSVGAVLLAAIALLAWWLGWRQANLPLLIEDQTGVIALLPVENETGDERLEWAELGLGSLMSRALEGLPDLKVRSFDQTLEVLKDLEPGTGGSADPEKSGENKRVDSLDSTARALGAKILVRSTMRGTSDEPVLSVSLNHIEGGSRRAVFRGRDVMLLTEHASDWLVDLLVGSDSAVESQLSEFPIANLMFARGFDAKRRIGPAAGMDYFEVSLREDPELLQAQVELLEARFQSGEIGGDAPEFSEALKLTMDADRTDLETKVRLLRLRSILVAGETERAAGLAQELIERSRQLNDRLSEAEATRMLGFLEFQQGRAAQARELALESRKLFRLEGSVWDEARVEGNLGVFALREGNFEQSKLHYQTLAELGRQIQAPPLVMLGRGGEASAWASKGFPEKAIPVQEELAANYEARGDLRTAAEVVTELARSLRKARGIDGARPAFERAMELGRQLEDVELLATNGANLGGALLDEGRAEEAQPYVEEALNSGVWFAEHPLGYRLRVQLLEGLGQKEEAYRYLKGVYDRSPPAVQRELEGDLTALR